MDFVSGTQKAATEEKKLQEHSTRFYSQDPRREKQMRSTTLKGLTRALIQFLREAGCDFERQGKGDHEIWYSPITGIHFVVDQSIKSRHTQTVF